MTLVYGTAGGAAGELRSNFAIPAGTTNTTVTYGTWTAGAGLEYCITDNLSARIEYLYLDKGNKHPIAQKHLLPIPRA